MPTIRPFDRLCRELHRLDRMLAPVVSATGDAEASALARALASDHAPHGGAEEPVLAGLVRACMVFRLSAFERDTLLLAIAPEVDARYAALFARLQGDPARRRPTIGLVARVLAPLLAHDVTAAVATLGANAHLHHTGLIEISGDGPRSERACIVPASFWPRLLDLAAPVPFEIHGHTPDALSRLVLRIETREAVKGVLAWAARRRPHELAILVDGASGSGRETLAIALASELGFGALVVEPNQIEHGDQIRAIVREAAWNGAAVVVRHGASSDALARLGREVSTPLLAVADANAWRDLGLAGPRATIGIEIAPLQQEERAQLWNQILREYPGTVDGGGLAGSYRFGPGKVRGVVAAANIRRETRGDSDIVLDDIRAACRVGLVTAGSLAMRVECPYEEADIVLTSAARRELSLILAWSRHGAATFAAGGSGARLKGTGGLVCLFAGPPGTGKTMAAQILARSLQLHMLRVDLSQVVNKYIGETEKNLERVFQEAEATGSLLFFDEADALFGKRTDVHNAHDRYANIETAFLLQRLEIHPGIVILATNLQHNVDAAFLRRIQVIAEFPIPGATEREAIWERHLSRDHLAGDIDLGVLANMFPLAGGDIRNAVVTGLLLAANERKPVAMRHLVIGVWRELHKTGRLMSPDDFGKWRDDIIAYVRDGVVA